MHSLYIGCWEALVLACRQYAVSDTFHHDESNSFSDRAFRMHSGISKLLMPLLSLVFALQTSEVLQIHRHAVSSPQ